MKKKEVCGFALEINNNNKIFSVSPNCGLGPTIKVGQEVKSNGRWMINGGTKGTVVEIFEPFAKGYTDNIISVLFYFHDFPLRMKFKDLEF